MSSPTATWRSWMCIDIKCRSFLREGVTGRDAARPLGEPVAHGAALEPREAEQRQLAAVLARRGVGRRDELHAQERLARLVAHEVTPRDRAFEVVEHRVEPGDVARVHPV